ncbi:alpha-(1,3)-fucosyltransferase 9-like [Poecilia reticulata]|uniref:alpha-(1,3)-fucosyltransferase 9-like n=1 Tax=Poecilia reticulata TaxID=8081 RepID=UPI0004A39D71|nr:PREDICTED: alpha-(1,3)-fucosyltransferase 9-like [Poecilia reticulata]
MEPTGQSKPSGSFHKILRLVLFSVFILELFMTIFLMYYKPPTTWLNHRSSDSTKNIQNVYTATNDKNMTIVLIWLWPFGTKYEANVCSSIFNIEGCFITADRNFYSKSDGVVIHHREIAGDLSNLPKSQRPPFQKWIWMNFESPSNSEQIPGINNLFNLTLGYRRDSDIHVAYGSIVAADTVEDFVPPSKNKLVCWIVSNWSPDFTRSKYYDELKNHIKIQTYGRAFQKSLSKNDYLNTMSSCKFYLSFENSVHKDYITEKLYIPLSVGTVPVVLGTTRENYENFVPRDAFIHVDDFKSPKELADYLLLLDKNQELYLEYFRWRRHFRASINSVAENTCKACNYLRWKNEYRAFKNLNKWFWG